MYGLWSNYDGLEKCTSMMALNFSSLFLEVLKYQKLIGLIAIFGQKDFCNVFNLIKLCSWYYYYQFLYW